MPLQRATSLLATWLARAVENPSCRYSAWQCLSLAGDLRPTSCDAALPAETIQERAWTPPIWYTPER